MMKAVRWLLIAVVVLVVLATLVYSASRLRGASAEQQAALTLLNESEPPAGRNAFAAIWLLPYEVPEAQQETIAVEDGRRFREHPRPGIEGWDGEDYEPFVSVAADRYRDLRVEPVDGGAQYCHRHTDNCLVAIRSEPDEYAVLVQRDAALLARVAAIATYDHYRNLLPERIDMPLPPFQYLLWTTTQSALAFVQGEVDLGLTGVCRDVSTGRMLATRADNLIAGMIGVVMIERNARLFAEMLAEIPAEHPLPAVCATAFAPPDIDEFSACGLMRGEARFVFAGMVELSIGRQLPGNWWTDRLFPFLFDAQKTIERQAPQLAWYCGQEAFHQRSADRPVQASVPRPSSWRLECAGNLIGCGFFDFANVEFDTYQHRLQDAGAQLDLLATLLWLREADNETALAQRLRQRPSVPGRTMRAARIGDDGTSLAIDLHFRRDRSDWDLPLPASRLPPSH